MHCIFSSWTTYASYPRRPSVLKVIFQNRRCHLWRVATSLTHDSPRKHCRHDNVTFFGMGPGVDSEVLCTVALSNSILMIICCMTSFTLPGTDGKDFVGTRHRRNLGEPPGERVKTSRVLYPLFPPSPDTRMSLAQAIHHNADPE
jgi:hypothetical protein